MNDFKDAPDLTGSIATTLCMKHSYKNLISKINVNPFYANKQSSCALFEADCRDILRAMPANSIDMIFADPPYFLSNGGMSCHAGKRVCVNKGEWDKSKGIEETHKFNIEWLKLCQDTLVQDGTIWVSGTAHLAIAHSDKT